MSGRIQHPRRRGVLGAAVASLAAAGTEAAAQTAPRTFVLVHGAWHGGWCWSRVADRLRGAGHRVFTPTNTGLGERSHLLSRDVNVSTHVADVVNTMRWEDLSEVVLVGHSYGGLVISGVADAVTERIASIVFLDAFVPADGENLASRSQYPDAIAAAVQRGDVSLPAPPAAGFGVGDPADAAWVNAKMTPQPFGTYLEHVRYAGGRERIAKRAFLRCAAHPSPVFDANYAAAKASPGWRTGEFACGHDVMVIEPAGLTARLLELA